MRGVELQRHRARTRSSRAFAETAVEFGGIDILVSNAGIASSAPIEDTDARAVEQATWTSSSTGYFLVSREAFRLLQRAEARRQRSSSSPPRTASPPRRTPRPIAPPRPPRSISPAAWRSKARPHGIRVNVVNPDAVLRGSKIWPGEWREQRAAAYKIDTRRAGGALPPALAAEAHRASRRTSPRRSTSSPPTLSAKSTGNIVNVDAGNAQAFTR